jgi:hypothetical protein
MKRQSLAQLATRIQKLKCPLARADADALAREAFATKRAGGPESAQFRSKLLAVQLFVDRKEARQRERDGGVTEGDAK